MKNKIKAAFLPMYISLYDQASEYMRQEITPFIQTLTHELSNLGLEIVTLPICCVEKEFKSAIKHAEQAQAQALITWHAAYSPSLESSEVLAETNLPLVILNTTPDYDFSHTIDPDRISYNHGIHGVQDMCNLLLRNQKSFLLETGHWKESNVLERVAKACRAAALASSIQNCRIGRIGEPFKGMGDFSLPSAILRENLGIHTIEILPQRLNELMPAAEDDLVQKEMALDHSTFTLEQVDPTLHTIATQTSLALRNLIEKEQLHGFTLNFLEVDQTKTIPTMPFLEISKAMTRGIGYSGEGDVLTAGLVSSLLSIFPETSFTEIFCPDWKGNSLFLSHMGEINLNLAATKPILSSMDWKFTNAQNPLRATACFKPGDAVFVNLAPSSDDSFLCIIAPVTMLEIPSKKDAFKETIHGWMKPSMPIDSFLTEFSLLGGTHHSALVYGDVVDELIMFGELMNWDIAVLN